MASLLPFQFGDIVHTIHICHWIRTKCINPDNNASLKYEEFKRDVEIIEDLLEELKDAFPESKDDDILHRQSRLTTPSNSTEDRLEAQAKALIGNYEATLLDCRALLLEYGRYGDNETNILQNAFWHIEVQERVDELRKRLQTHAHHIRLILEPLQLKIMKDIREDVKTLLALSRKRSPSEAATEIPDVPESIKPKLNEAIRRNQPLSPDPEILLRTLAFHFRHSTVSARGSSQGVEQYLNLLKANYMARFIKKSLSFNALGSDHLYRRILDQIEQHIAAEYQREDLFRYSDSTLVELKDNIFDIWPSKKRRKKPDPLIPGPGEEEIGRLDLMIEDDPDPSRLYVFRVSDQRLRLVVSESHIDDNNIHQVTNTPISLNLHRDIFIPHSAFFSAANPAKTWVQVGEEKFLKAWEFGTKDDAQRFQGACTKHEVVAIEENVVCSVIYRSQGRTRKLRSLITQDKQSVGQGNVQLWQWPDPENLNILSPTQSPGEDTSFRTQSQAQSQTSTVFSHLDASTVRYGETSRGNYVLAKAPNPPILALFWKSGVGNRERYNMWKIDISYLVMKLHDSRSPATYGIQLTVNAKFDTLAEAILDIEKDSIDSCNLLALAHSEHSSRSSVKRVSLQYLTLHFQSKDDRDDFCLKLQIVKGKRSEQLLSLQIGEHTAKKNSIQRLPQSPTRTLSISSTQLSPLPRHDSIRKDSLPVLPVLDPVEPFQVSLGAEAKPLHDTGHEDSDDHEPGDKETKI